MGLIAAAVGPEHVALWNNATASLKHHPSSVSRCPRYAGHCAFPRNIHMKLMEGRIPKFRSRMSCLLRFESKLSSLHDWVRM